MYDVIIVGGGVAGAYLASKLSGLNVLLIEKNKSVIPKDSGIVSESFFRFFDKKLVKDEINRMDIVSPFGHRFTLHDRTPFAYILKRELFGKYLRARARKGAKILHENVLGVSYGHNFATVHTTGGQYKCKIVVGADGANSVVRRYARIERPLLSLGLMVKTKSNLEGSINVFFDNMFSPDFFAWIIPQNNEYGLITSVRPREKMKNFEEKFFLPGGDVYAYLIPTGYVKSYSDNTILVGDSCGQNKPLTGGGIIFGLKSADHAATIIHDAFEKNKFSANFLRYYETMWKKDLAWEIDKQFLARMLYKRLTNTQIDKIFLELGPNIEKLSNFDYDRLSNSWIKMPKIKLLRAAVSSIL